jgi:hypothetical protein
MSDLTSNESSIISNATQMNYATQNRETDIKEKQLLLQQFQAELINKEEHNEGVHKINAAALLRDQAAGPSGSKGNTTDESNKANSDEGSGNESG